MQKYIKMTSIEIFNAYVPYEVICKVSSEEATLYYVGVYKQIDTSSCIPIWDLSEVKLILKPLNTIDWSKCESDMGNYLTEEMERFIDGYKVKWFHILDAPYLLVQWLIKNHYDVFGAIEKGIAISE